MKQAINIKSKQIMTFQLTFTAIMAAVICVLGPFSVPLPFSPVPISFTNLAIYLAVFILGSKWGTISYFVYLLLGLVGLPVFSNFTGGVGKLAGPTGGYLIGFIFMAWTAGIFIEKSKGHIVVSILGMIVGTAIAYAFGTAWLAQQSHISFMKAFTLGVIPFLLGDILKIALIAVMGPLLRKNLIKSGLVMG